MASDKPKIKLEENKSITKKSRVPKGHKRLTIEDRVKLLLRLKEGEKARNLAVEYGVTEGSISYIKKNSDNILEKEKTIRDHGGQITKKRCTGIEGSSRDEALYQWYLQKKSKGYRVTGPMLREKAAKLNVLLGGPTNFKASTGFMNGFKRRYGIREKPSPDRNASVDFITTFRQYVDENSISFDCIYNADETGLVWKTLPNKSILSKAKLQTSRAKKCGEGVTVMVCANASGTHKIPLMLIGKSTKPRCFRDVQNLPVIYKSEKSACMDKILMLEWYKEVFLPAIVEEHGPGEKKCILLLDNAPSHLPAEDFNEINPICEIFYLPPNVNSLIQPMGQGVIQKLKQGYKEYLLRLIISAQDIDTVNATQSSISLRHCSSFITSAWNELTIEILRKAWKSIFTDELNGPVGHSANDIDNFRSLMVQLPADCQLSDKEITTWLQIDADDPGWSVLSHVEIVHEQCLDECSPEEDEPQEELQCITPTDALKCAEKLLFWCAIQDQSSTEVLKNLQQAQDFIINIKNSQSKNT